MSAEWITHQYFKKLIFLLLSGILIFSSCRKKTGLVIRDDIHTLPSATARDIETIFTDSGKLQLILKAPLLEQYNNADIPYTEFRFGINVVFYEGSQAPTARVSSKYAKYTEPRALWELRDSVVAVNAENDMVETELLYWDQEKNLFYTDRFVKITDQDQVTMGTGFEYDPRKETRRIKNVTATFYISNEQKVTPDP